MGAHNRGGDLTCSDNFASMEAWHSAASMEVVNSVHGSQKMCFCGNRHMYLEDVSTSVEVIHVHKRDPSMEVHEFPWKLMHFLEIWVSSM